MALLLAALSLLCSCTREKVYRIGVSQCSDDDWRNKMNEEILREIMLHPEADVEIRSANDSNDRQIADIRYFIDNKFDIIIAAPNEAAAITPIIKEAYDGGIPVVVFDRHILGDSYTAFIGADNEGLGRQAASYARTLVGPGAKVIEIRGLEGSTPAAGRHAGFMAAADSLQLDVVAAGYGNWNADDARRVADSLLVLHPEAELIYAHNDRMAIAASQVARSRGLDLKVIGIDAAPEIGLPAVIDGTIDATFIYPTQGEELVRTALDILEGRPYQRINELPMVSVVDKSNADILLLQANALQEETRKIEILKSQVDEYLTRQAAQRVLIYAAVAILALLIGIIFIILRLYWNRRRYELRLMEQNKVLEQQRDNEMALNEQIKQATHSKLVFFTNVSHDLRTPLTLIAEPVDQLCDAPNLTEGQHTLARIARKNVHILLRLINQILDFRKYENGQLDLDLHEVELKPLAREWADSFTTAAHRRHIRFDVDIDLPDGFTVAIDPGKMERVAFNLLSNAFKFTPDNGRIRFSLSIVEADGATRLRMAVADNGRGMAAGELDRIFERFYQSDRINPNGSGIGLALVKAFVELHSGEVSVTSEPGKGSEFTVWIPLRHLDEKPQLPEVAITAPVVDTELDAVDIPAGGEADRELPILLVIDDNDDMRALIRGILEDEYRVIEARDGREGLRRACRHVPDLILCDVMMPGMDGLECCRRLKQEISTSHIPVLMLTACALDRQRLEGYESGADGYLPKPFDGTMLRVRCRNLIENRRRIIAGVRPDSAPAAVPVSPAPPTSLPNASAPVATDLDSEFYTAFQALLEKHLPNPDLNIDSLASDMGMGRSQLYRKIKALTNYSPVELLRNARLNRARELVTTTDRNISEIAYQVGFTSPAYFTRCYRETFGETPSEARTRLGR